jgi:DNA polymerase-3 subunit gamma/tau
MSYQVLARKWRPRTFHELVGQDHVRRALVNALDQGRLHHAYLFTGTRGVGKTTLARILAKCLNCTANGQGDDGVTSTPCGQCDSCRSIDEGRFVDLIEVDAASRTKVEDTRELLDNVQYAPTLGRYKVYLIDEVHMLSTHSFNALLKTLEEPPPHVKFLLATTDPQKLPPTVLSRCLQFTLKHMPPERVVGHLTTVLRAEGVDFDESALWLLGKAAEGSMRDAMSLTDQAIAFGQGEVRHADVAAMLGTLDHRHVLALMEAMAEVNAARVLAEVSQLAEQGPDFAAVLDDVTGMLHRLAVAQMVPDALDNAHGDRDSLLSLASRFTAEDIQLYYQIGIQGRGDMEHAPDLRAALEMTLLRMLAFRPQGVPKPPKTPLPLGGAPGRDVAESNSPAPDDVGSDQTPPPAAAAAAEPSAELSTAPSSSVTETPKPADSAVPRSTESTPVEAPTPDEVPPPVEEPPPWLDSEPTDASGTNATADHEASMAEKVLMDRMAEEPPAPVEPEKTAAPPMAPEPPPSPQPESAQPAAAPVAGATGRIEHDDWLARFDSLGLGGLTRNLAANCVVEEDDGERLWLRLDPSLAAMQADIHLQRMEQALASLGFERRLVVEVGALPEAVESPKQQTDRLAAQRLAEAVEALTHDPHIQELQKTFGARLIQSTVKPADAQT